MAGFSRRTSIPVHNKFYISSSTSNDYGQTGYSTCIVCGDSDLNVLPNCVGYACGRFNEIIGEMKYPSLNCDAKSFVSRARSTYPDLLIASEPTLGGIMSWGGTEHGHVAVVEYVNKSEGYCEISESNYGRGRDTGLFWRSYKVYKSNNWSVYGMPFLGCIVNPAVANGDVALLADGASFLTGSVSSGGSYTEASYSSFVWPNLSKSYDVKKKKTKYNTVTTTLTRNSLTSANVDLAESRKASLLSYPSLVESPFVIVKVGNYTFGNFTKEGDWNRVNSVVKVDYPNYMTGVDIVKINGTVNQYTLKMTYQVEAGNDPNLIDKIFSSVGYGTIKISYGDWMSPSFIYKEEEAMITGVSSNVDFQASRISYTVTCTSNSLALSGGAFNFPARTAKPSDIIKELLANNQYGLQDVFYGMKNLTQVKLRDLIASDDRTVDIDSKESIDPISYINYLVTYMTSNKDSGDSPIKTASYFMTIHDDTYGEQNLGGPYFKVTKVEVGANAKTLASADTYEVDIGYPGDNLVTSFTIKNDNSWSLLYNYSEKINNNNYTYSIDDNGEIRQNYSPNIMTSSTKFKTTQAQKTWWTNVTQFPISAELTIKGLVRPAMLMTYVRVNAFFFGQRHISSGLYFIVKQEDKIDSSGYRTVLSLTRVGGDEDWYEKNTTTVTSRVPYF